jgi:type I restriction enzyme R subunit
MQAIARVNRVFKDKPGGLVVDYLGLADQLRNALANYTQNGGTGTTAIDQEEAVAIMLEKYEICLGLFHGFDWSAWASGTSKQCLKIIPQAMEFILAQKDGKERFLKSVTELSKAFALAVPHEKALEIRDDVGFFQAVRAAIAKSTSISGKTDEDLDQAIKQIISKTIVSEKVIDIFDAAGIKKPDISILSDEFLVEMKDLPQKNLAVELLRKLLNDEIKTMSKKNLVKSRSFSEMLEKTMKEYQSRAIETAEALRWLISLAKEMREENSRSKKLHLSDEEVAFYDALATNESAVNLLGDETLKKIAKELVETVQKNLTIDWSIREGARAKLRVLIKRTLKRYNYPPDKQELATNIVIEQTELFCGEQE